MGALLTPNGPDTDGMWAATEGLPEQFEAGVAVASSVDLPAADGVANVVALGMGGSGIGNDILGAIAAPLCPVPIVIGKDYEIPAFVGPDTLVFAASYSGNTEETVGACAQAIERGARVIAVTSGGSLATIAPYVVPLPSTVPHPRAGVGAMAAAPLAILSRLGLLQGVSLPAASEQLARRRDELVTAGSTSVAARVARRIGRTIPLIYGGGLIGRAAALRWKCQVNENPKTPAFSAAHPELCHNELTGWGQLGDVTRQLITLVDLRHDYEHHQVARRFELVDEIMDEVVASVVEVRAEGDGPLAQLMDLVIVGDFTALWLAAQEGLDPGPIPVLTSLKEALAR